MKQKVRQKSGIFGLKVEYSDEFEKINTAEIIKSIEVNKSIKRRLKTGQLDQESMISDS